jgi:NitT/TauT family transport system permease protein
MARYSGLGILRLAQFWALTIILFAFAMMVAELIERVERKVEFYAGAR